MTRFDWDEDKNRTNLNKHGLGFETAVGAFADPNAIARVDRVVDGEDRWQTIGCLEDGTLVILVVHTLADKDVEVVVRLISARKATPRERRLYEKGDWGE